MKAQTRAEKTTRDPRWSAVVTRDQRADRQFVYAVATTGVYCRPSCAARRAKPENVGFYATAVEAEKAGFRACKRCKPNDVPRAEQLAALVAKLCAQMEQSEEPPTLEELAKEARLSTFHLHRVFKRITGLTPREYALAQRGKRIARELARTKTVTEAIYGAGFNSNGRFYEQADHFLGMTPTNYRQRGANTEIRFAVGECSLGAILVAASARGVCAILMGDDPEALVRDLQDRFREATLVGGDKAFEDLVARVVGLVEAPQLGIDLPLDVRGTAFQERVWKALREIPAGKTTTYSELAGRIGAPKAVRAVASACAANPAAIAIPCHRVVRIDGSLSGYRWGIERKRALLTREANKKTPRD